MGKITPDLFFLESVFSFSMLPNEYLLVDALAGLTAVGAVPTMGADVVGGSKGTESEPDTPALEGLLGLSSLTEQSV